MSLPRYGEYKDSGAAWFAAIPVHWEASVLRRVVSRVESGVSVNAVDEPAGADALGVLKTSCVYTGKFDAGENKAVVAEELERVACPVKAGTLIVSRMNTPTLVGAAGLVQEDVGNLFLPDRLWQVHFSGALPRFAHYWTASPPYRAQVQTACAGTSASMQNLSQDDFLSFVLPLPPQDEQAAIAAFLDRETAQIDALIAEQEKLIALLAEKRQATISHAVTRGLNPNAPMKDSGVAWLGNVPAHWGVTRLKYASDAVVDCPHETPVYDEGGPYRVIRTADVSEGRLHLDAMYSVAQQEFLLRIRRMALERNDIVYGREGERWGFAAQVPESSLYCLGQRMMQFRAAFGMHARFLMWQLNAQSTYRQGQMDTVGATSPHVNVGTIRNYALTEPPTGEQAAISEFLDAETSRLDRLDAEAQRAISLLRERRSALIAAAVIGQIDVRCAVATHPEEHDALAA